MTKKLINISIFLFIFLLYLVSFFMIYDAFKEKKSAILEKNALDKFDKEVKIKENSNPKTSTINSNSVNYGNYTILGKIDIPKIGFTSVIIKEYTYRAMDVGVIKSHGVELNTPGGFIISGHNFRGHSLFMYNIYRLRDGDKFSIISSNGTKMEYTVYDVIRNADPSDASLYQKYDDINATLMTCEDDGGKTRIVVKARVVE